MDEEITAVRKCRAALEEQALLREQLLVSKFIGGLKFSRRLWGVDELQVWKAMERLTALYEEALTLERSRRELAQRRLEALQKEEGAHGSP